MSGLSDGLALVAMLMFGGGVALCLPREGWRQQAARRLVQLGSMVLLASFLDDLTTLLPLVMLWANVACVSWVGQRGWSQVPGPAWGILLATVLLLVAWNPYADAAVVAWICALALAATSAIVCIVERSELGLEIFDDDDDEEDEDLGSAEGAEAGRKTLDVVGGTGAGDAGATDKDAGDAGTTDKGAGDAGAADKDADPECAGDKSADPVPADPEAGE